MKPLLPPGLNSRVARRLFVLFLVAAMIPVGGLAVFSYTQVSDSLVELNYRRLQHDARSLGMNLVQRLTWREEALLHLRRVVAAAGDAERASEIPGRTAAFSSLQVVGAETLQNLAPRQLAHLAKSKVLLTSENDEPVMLAVIPESANLMRATLATDALWSDEAAVVPYCILSNGGVARYCTPGLTRQAAEQWRAHASGRNAGVFPWQADGEEYLAAYWRVPLQASLSNEGFILLVSDEKRDVFAVLARFRQTFPAVMVLALALAVWLAISQIRRQMRPLEQLEAGARKLGQGDLASRVKVTGNNEFAGLAQSFNRMAEGLQHKFHLLQALGELDRAILAASEMDYVIRTLLEKLPLAVACDAAGVMRFDEKGRPQRLCTNADPLHPEGVQAELSPASAQQRDWGFDAPWLVLDLADPVPNGMHYFADQGATQALVFPARIGQRLDSALILAYRKPPADSGEIIQAGRSLADRLAAAGSSIAWEDKLYRQAHYDAVTQLPNRVMLRDRVEQALLRANREDRSVAVMLLDLDDFKQVNDSLGHAVGDALLLSVAERLLTQARQTDTVARLGGDEFVILIPDLPKAGALTIVDRVARQVNQTLARPVEIAGRQLSSPASIGIALFPENASSYDELLLTADTAMYESKREQQGAYRFYTNGMNAEILARFELAQEVREAMEREEFFLVYQPKIEASSGRIVGAEALARWASPKRGTVSPGLFVPVVDELGLGARLGEWVLNTACAQMAAWRKMGRAPLVVSVNMSHAQFDSGEIVSQVQAAVARNALAPQHLQLEILESIAVSESGEALASLAELRKMGVEIALDDFGTGYSSLVYLTKLPANVLKIDRAFIVGLLSDPRQQAIVERIISLAKVLDYTVVAEGVEHVAQATMLAAMGCDQFQGYVFSRPLAVNDFARLVDTTPAYLWPSS